MGTNQESLCWTCQNAYAHKCCWMDRCHPVEGWDAVPTRIRMSGDGGEGTTRSYLVRGCPNYVPEVVRYDKGACPVCGTVFTKKPQNRKYCSTACRELARLRSLMKGIQGIPLAPEGTRVNGFKK